MAHKVRFINYQKQFKKMEAEIMGTIKEVLTNGDLMMRQQLESFETNLAAYVGTPAAVGLNSCTDGLHLSLKALGVGPGDEVITVSHTFVATVSAIHHCGATPIFADLGPDHAMDPASVEKRITKKTKVILPVHVNGYVCAMDEIMNIAKSHNIEVLEDSAQALGAHYKGKRGGSWGIGGCFSFYPAKQLGCFGDGGAVTTNSPELAQQLMYLRNHGRMENGELSGFSYNSRLDNLHAAILDLKLKVVDQWIAERRAIAQKYHDALCDIPELVLPLPPSKEDVRFHSYQNYEVEAENRDQLLAKMREEGIEIILPWGGKAVHQFKSLGLSDWAKELPETERVFSKIQTLPMHNELEESDTDYVISVVRKFYGR